MAGRALVLGGGGFTGIAWELGLVAGLRERGVDLSEADLILGTSAGSVVGSLVASEGDLESFYATLLTPAEGESAASLSRSVKLRFVLAMFGSRAPERVLRRIGRISLRASVVPEEERIQAIAAQMPIHDWPVRPLKITAIDAESGELRLFDRASGVPLVRAIAASCAVPGVWPPVTIEGRLYMDGGMRSPTNADLALGYARVIVIAPLSRRFGPLPGDFAHVQALRERAGVRVELITPDDASMKAMGPNMLDPGRRADAARAGRAQAAAVIDRIRATWSGLLAQPAEGRYG